MGDYHSSSAPQDSGQRSTTRQKHLYSLPLPPKVSTMEELPPSLLIDILSRLPDSADLVRCRLVSKTLNASSYEVRALSHLCTPSRYHKYRSRNDNHLARTTPFKSAFKNVVLNSRGLETISIGVEKSLGRKSYDEIEDDGDDLYLTDVRFLEEWLPVIGGGLKSLSISDFWSQSSWRRSDALAFISSFCKFFLDLSGISFLVISVKKLVFNRLILMICPRTLNLVANLIKLRMKVKSWTEKCM